MNRIRTCACLAISLIFILTTEPARAQESVEVPQLLQKDVHAFKLTVDSLKNLTENIRAHTKAVASELQLLQKKLQLLPKGSKRYRLQRRRYEEKFSAYLAQKYAMLRDMQNLRLRTLGALENILQQLQDPDDSAVTAWREKMSEELRRNEDRIAQTRLEMLQILAELKKPDQTDAARIRLSRQFQSLQNNRLALYLENKTRLARLMQEAGQNTGELPQVRNALLTIRDNLQSGFEWIETEMAYINLYAEHRKNRLAIDARLVEVTGLIDRFREIITQINGSSELLRDVERFERQLRPADNAASSLPTIPPLKWPGQPETSSGKKMLTPTDADSLRRLIEAQLQTHKKEGTE